jgi:hypothetical protein
VIDSVILGIGYRARSGKNAVAAAIIAARTPEYDIKEYGFANALKREVTYDMELFGGPKKVLEIYRQEYQMPDWVQLESDSDMTDPLCPFGKFRKLLQWYGSEFRRDHDGPDYWVQQLAKRIEIEKPALALVTDVRFFNEVAFCKEYGEVIRVDRPNLPKATHKSETSLDGMLDSEWSLIISNEGTLEELQSKAVEAFDMLMTSFPHGYGVGV